jgi:hypothetical protein
MASAVAAVGQDFSRSGFREAQSSVVEWPASHGTFASGLEGVNLPSVMAINRDSFVDSAPSQSQVSEQAPNSRGGLISRVSQFAEQHPTIFWSTAAVAAFGVATAASTIAASSGGVLLPALATTAKFGATLAAALAVRDVSLLIPWLQTSSR